MKSTAKTFEEFKIEISKLAIDEKLYLDETCLGRIYNELYIDFRSYDYDDYKEYSWCAERKPFGYFFPMKNANEIKTFKTRSGCKRNLINHFKSFFDQ